VVLRAKTAFAARHGALDAMAARRFVSRLTFCQFRLSYSPGNSILDFRFWIGGPSLVESRNSKIQVAESVNLKSKI
jgi:hypothetical protein